jgi:hypothetical protein
MQINKTMTAIFRRSINISFKNQKKLRIYRAIFLLQCILIMIINPRSVFLYRAQVHSWFPIFNWRSNTTNFYGRTAIWVASWTIKYIRVCIYTILYENVFQNPLISRRTVEMIPQHSTFFNKTANLEKKNSIICPLN